MKSVKNTLIAATLSVAVVFGCAKFIEIGNNAEMTSPQPQSEIAKADLPVDQTLFHGGVRAEVIIGVPP